MKIIFLNIVLLLFCFSVKAQEITLTELDTPLSQAEIQPQTQQEVPKTEIENPEENENLKPADYKVFDGNNLETLNAGFKSLLFNQEQVGLFYDFLVNNKTNYQDIKNLVLSLPNAVNQASQDSEKPSVITMESPSFYLKTIILPEDKNWTIWYNQLKVRKEQLSDTNDIEVVKVTEDKVTFIYRNIYLSQLSPKYSEKLLPITNQNPEAREKNSSWDYISKKGDIVIDTIKGVVRFTLGVNQTFSLFDAEIFEGYKPATQVEVNIEQASASQPNKKPSEEKQNLNEPSKSNFQPAAPVIKNF